MRTCFSEKMVVMNAISRKIIFYVINKSLCTHMTDMRNKRLIPKSFTASDTKDNTIQAGLC